MNGYVLMMYYAKYLKEIIKVSDSTVKHYQDALKYISRYLVHKQKLQETIYEIQDIAELETIREYLYNDPDFVSLDKRGHKMYSTGLNHYFKFANGAGFANIHQEILELDMEVPVPQRQNRTLETWNRSSVIKRQIIEAASYRCEVNSEHVTFTAKSTGYPYMEGHHVIPMRFQREFSVSLDIYANVICLCPICHRLLHYGIAMEKQKIVDKIYYDRAERLAVSGIRLSKDEFRRFVC